MRQGYEVIVAPDGQAAIAKAQAERPDLILMDLNLPILDGWEATRRLKSATDTGHIAIIALTAHAMKGDEERARAVGCDDYEIKPVNFPRLLAKIQQHLQG